MPKAITGKEISKKACKVCEANGEIFLAVSYWGRGATDALKLTSRAEQVHVVLNVAHGGTNPEELEALMKILPGRVRVHPTLHSKIYASEKRAVLGSANASAPGLCWNETGHDEAAAMMKGDDASSAFELAKKFYRKGKSASEEHLQMCRERFGRRTLASTVTCTYNADGDAGRENPIDTFLRRADVFGALPVIISEGNADPKVLEKDWQEQRAESEELPENATFNGLEWSYFQWPLDKRYRGKACLEIHKESNGHLSLHVVQPIFHEGSVGTFARRLSWPDVGDLGQHWRAKVRNIGSDGTLNRVHRALRKKAYLTGWDVYAKYRAKSTS